MTLISILSNDITNITPIIYEFKDKITHHITIYDDATLELTHLQDLTNGIKHLQKKYKLKFKTSNFMLDEDSRSSIEQTIVKVLNSVNEPKKLYLNSSSTMAHLSILFANEVMNYGGKVLVYDTHDNSYIQLTQMSMKSKAIKNSMNIDDFVMMLDKPIIEYADESYLKPRKKEIMKLFGEFERFKKVRSALLKGKQHFNYADYPDIIQSLKALKIAKNGKIDKALIGGGLFEEYIYWLVKAMDFDDVKCNVKIQIEDIATKTIRNEIDVMMIKNNHLYLIECKLSSKLSGIEVIYKYDSIMCSFGDDSKTMIVNISDKKKKKFLNRYTSENFTQSDVIRGLVHSIDIYHRKELDVEDFRTQVREFFNG